MNFVKAIFLIGSITVGSACNCQTKTGNEKHLGKDSLNNTKQEMARSKEIACKLTSAEMQKRRAEVLASLKNKVLDKKELGDGYIFKFESSDLVIDELIAFVKTERLCCDFFNFSILISADEDCTWLSITGPKGAKEFIELEMDL